LYTKIKLWVFIIIGLYLVVCVILYFFQEKLLFKSADTKGAVLFLHGNGGAIHDWGHGAGLYTQNNYDVLYLDYREYGKSWW